MFKHPPCLVSFYSTSRHLSSGTFGEMLRASEYFHQMPDETAQRAVFSRKALRFSKNDTKL